jgi:hypothetical protein
MIPPDGEAKPMAAASPWVYECGAAPGPTPHDVSGLSDSVKSSVPPLLMTEAGNQVLFHECPSTLSACT